VPLRTVVLLGALVSVLGIGASFAQAQPKPPTLSEAQKQKLEAGEVLTRARLVQPHDATLARAMGVIEASPEDVWRHIDRCEHFKEFVPRVVESEVLSREGEILRFRSKVDMPFPLKDIESELKCRHRDYGGKVFERRWKGLTGPLHVNEGFWRIFPWPGKRTLVVYTARIAPRARIPAKLRVAAQRITLPKTVLALRKRATKQ